VRFPTVLWLAVLWFPGAWLCSPAGAADPAPVDFAREIAPLFSRYCQKCHGAERARGGLRVDTAAGLTAGGDSGPLFAATPDTPALLWQVLSGAEGVSAMPPAENPRPTADELALVRRWLDEGAQRPATDAPVAAATAPADPRASHWAFRPIRRGVPPQVAPGSPVRNPLDQFILARLGAEQLTPAPEADRVTQIRRLSFDLLGLPPSPSEVAAFVEDTAPHAYERLVDRLLQSPHFGERWGRHWLDLARYADSNGFTRDTARSIWLYREWVVEALNRDLPFDQFTIEQLAGDMLPGATQAQQIATGFHRNTLVNEEGGTDPEQFRVESVVDRVNTTGQVFLGLTIGCAQCHEHKYDPISQREYYQFYAFLNNADEPRLEVPTPEQLAQQLPQRRDQLQAEIAQLEQQFATRQAEFEQAIAAWEKTVSEEARKQLPMEVLNALNLSPVMRSEQNRKDLAAYYRKQPEARQAFPELEEIVRRVEQLPQFTTTLVMRERSEPRSTRIHIRGDFLRHGAEVEPAVPGVLPPLAVLSDRPNRLDLARWLVDPRNPLTARVTVNRMWQKLFGRGIVETENDFGLQGTPPSHPELLDWLAAEFMQPTVGASPGSDLGAQAPWSVKRLLKLLVCSATYRQSSVHRPELAEIDPANRLYARQQRVRLEAETIRDAALAASGRLDRRVGGASVNPPQPAGVYDFTQDKKPWATSTGPDRYRRGMYTYLWRSSPYPALTVFDFPDANVACTRRNRSNTPLQSLTLANDLQFLELAQALAQRVLAEGQPDDSSRLRLLWRLALAREPGGVELQRLSDLLAQQREGFAGHDSEAAQLAGQGAENAPPDGERAAWTALARVVLNLDEFITRE
jgi:mono/diheme cytochrome c family protein